MSANGEVFSKGERVVLNSPYGRMTYTGGSKAGGYLSIANGTVGEVAWAWGQSLRQHVPVLFADVQLMVPVHWLTRDDGKGGSDDE